jgi:hypothetical protein
VIHRFKTITTSLLAKYEAENPDFHCDFENFVKEILTDEAVPRGIILIRVH